MIFSFLFIYIFVVNIVYYVVHIVCEVDVIANSLVLYLPFFSTLNKNFFSLSSLLSSHFLSTVVILFMCTKMTGRPERLSTRCAFERFHVNVSKFVCIEGTRSCE